MSLFQLERQQIIPVSCDVAWSFFSNPSRLQLITPEWLNLVPQTPMAETMYPGMLITFRVTPFLGIPWQWVTEITQVSEPTYFVDEQRFGPYRFWHHQHHFEACAEGTQVTDLINYMVPPPIIGDGIARFIVAPKLASIFDYRARKIAAFFADGQSRD